MPIPVEIASIEEPFVNLDIFTPQEYIGPLMELSKSKRGELVDIVYSEVGSVGGRARATLKYKMPLNEIVYDFFDKLKSCSRGYASLDYNEAGYVKSELVKMDILLNSQVCDALSLIVHRDSAYEKGKAIVEKLKNVIPRQMFEVPIQAAIGQKILARETVKAMRKDVLAKCYGGDISRKRKLLEKQKEGKKRMRMLGNVEVPSEAFISILKI